MHRFRHFITTLILVTVTLVLALPFCLYKIGLNGIAGLPEKPLHIASKEQQALVWKSVGGNGLPRIKAMDPYSFAMTLLVKKDSSVPPDQLIVWQVGSRYLLNHQRNKGMSWWHLSGAALSIWLSRNWTDEEILSAAVLSQ